MVACKTTRVQPIGYLLWVLLLLWAPGSAQPFGDEARLHQLLGPAPFHAIEQLEACQTRRIAESVSAWSESDPELTGTLDQASRAVTFLCQSPDFGAGVVDAVVTRLEPRSAQAFLVALAGTAQDGREWSLARARDALTALEAGSSATSWPTTMAGLVNLDSLAELNALHMLDLRFLPAKKLFGLRQARLSVPSPNPGQKLQKVIKLKDMHRFLSGEFQPEVGGSVAFYDQVAFLRTPAQLIAGLRLDYPKGFVGETRVAALVFERPPQMRLRVPFDPLLGGDPMPDLVYPFTGTGFTASVGDRLVPELVISSGKRQPLPAGTQLFEIDETGLRHLRATLGSEGTWVLGR